MQLYKMISLQMTGVSINIDMYLLLLVCLWISAVNSDVDLMTVSSETRPYHLIPPTCKQPTSLDDVRTHSDIVQVISNTHSVWLPIVKLNFTVWKWMDGTVHAKRISSVEWTEPGRDCAVLRVKDKLIDDVTCNKTYSHLICEFHGNYNCDRKAKCLTHGGKSYIIYEKLGSTWFDAKQYCTQQNLTLASLSVTDLTLIKGRIAALFTSWADAWIGLRLTEYYIQTSNGNIPIHQYFWDTKDPCSCPNKKCVIMTRSVYKNDYVWKPANCSENHHYICISADKTVSEIITTKAANITRDDNSEDKTSNKTTVIVAVIVPVILIIVIVIACVLYRKGRKREGKQNDNVQNTTSAVEETEHHDDVEQPRNEGEAAQAEPLLNNNNQSPNSVPPPAYSENLPPNHTSAEPVPGPSTSNSQGASCCQDQAEMLPVKHDPASSLEQAEHSGGHEPSPQKRMSVQIWNTLTQAISRQLASHAKKDEQIISLKTFLMKGLEMENQDVENLQNKKELYNWETFKKEIEKWRGSSPRDIAWTDLIQILTDEQYETADVADAMLNLSIKLKEAEQ